MKRFLICFLFLASAASGQVLPGMLDSQKTLPGWLSDPNFTAPIFNGVNQYASATLAAPVTENWTVSFWAYPKSLSPSASVRMFSARDATNLGFEINIYSKTEMVVYFEAGPVSWQPTATTTYDWRYYTLKKEAASASLYLDGVLIGSRAINKNTAVTSTFHIGKFSEDFLYYGNFQMAELSIWNRALTATEINKYMPKRLKGTESGLIALYHLNDGAGVASQTLIDSVGGKNATCYNSVPWTPRRGYAAPDIRAEKYALSFDGVDDIASGSNTGISTYPYTIEGWIFTPTLTTGQSCYIGSISSSSSNLTAHYLTFGNVGGVPTARLLRWNSASTTTLLLSQDSRLGYGKNMHLAAVVSAYNAGALYLNGIQIATGTAAQAFPTGINRASVGGITANINYYGFGRLAEVRMWNTARTQAQIQANMYTTLAGSEDGLVHYYKFIEGTGTSVDDLGSDCKDLQLLNSPTWIGRSIP